ncbi:MAG: sigma 54-interacting transcriptional regulator [Nitrospirae bacterium]|nr:sigma 54-interacting transcriptional regulator [Nitrospirota bacterium]
MEENTFPIVFTSYYLSAGLALYTTIHSIIAVFNKDRISLNLSLAFFSFFIACFQITNSFYYHANTLAGASFFSKIQILFMCGAFLSGYLFFSIYTEFRRMTPGVILLVIFIGILIPVNLNSPHSLKFSTLEEVAPLRMAWGEELKQFSGVPTIWYGLFRSIHFGLLFFMGWRSLILYQKGKFLLSLTLSLSTVLFVLSGIWGVLIDLGKIHSIYFGGFIFVFVTLMMSFSLIQDRKSDFLTLTKAKDAIQEAEERYRNIFENAVEGMFQTTPSGSILLVNPAFAFMYGYDSPEEMIRLVPDITELYVDSKNRTEVKRLLDEQGFVKGFETRFFRKDGSVMWVSACVRTVRDSLGKVSYYEGTNEDITKRKEFEEAFRNADERYRNIFENAVEGIFQSTPDGKPLLVNPAQAALLDFNSAEEMFKSVQDVTSLYVDPEDRKEFVRLLAERGYVKDFETRFYRRDRSFTWVTINAKAIRDASGRVHHYDGTMEDISRRKHLIEASNAMISTLDLKELYLAIRPGLLRFMRADLVSITLYDSEKKQLRLNFLEYTGQEGMMHDSVLILEDGSALTEVLELLKPVHVNSVSKDLFPPELYQVFHKEKIDSLYCLPLLAHGLFIGILISGSRSPDTFNSENVDFLRQIASQCAIAIDNALAYRKITELKNKLSEEKLYLEAEISLEHNFGEIIGKSSAIRNVLKQVEIVSPTDSSALILGETGTGKELIARAIHRLSKRKDRNFVKINCGAVPAGLLESELFGHEKGAFTGALIQRVGRFELAHQGTLFLDEVGDIPLELQTKLLRVLQEHEFERLGSSKTIRVDVRIIAATNRDLNEMVARKEFRSDLYFRLKVFPILVPPLRDRQEDIPILIHHFAEKHAIRMSKQISNVPAFAMKSLLAYSWPGNVRELENLIERAVILSPGTTLQVPLSELNPIGTSENAGPMVSEDVVDSRNLSSKAGMSNIGTLEEAEREHILRALKASNWVIAGTKGAAELLGMKRSTLRAKMQKLGIPPRS